MSLHPDDNQQIDNNRQKLIKGKVENEYDPFKEAYEAAKKRLEEAGEQITVVRFGTDKPLEITENSTEMTEKPMETTGKSIETTKMDDFPTGIPAFSSEKPVVRPMCLTDECMSFVGKIVSFGGELGKKNFFHRKN